MKSRRAEVFCLRRAAGIILCTALCSCGPRKSVAPPPESVAPPVQAKSSERPASPFSLEIVEELNDGSNLHIHGRVLSATDWPADDIVVRLSGMKSGEAQKSIFYPLAKLQHQKADLRGMQRVAAGKPLDFYLSVPSVDLTDYQLELLWGKEAASVLPKTAQIAVAEKEGLLLQSLNVQRLVSNCASEPCPATYRLVGNLFNNSGESVEQAQLGVGFVWVPVGSKLDLSSQIPQDEENVEITGLSLAPQQSRAFKLDIDRVVPEVPDGSFQPVVRVISSLAKR